MGRKSTRRETGLSDEERVRLERVAGHPRSLRKHAWRARIVPGLGSGLGLVETIRRTGMSKPTVDLAMSPPGIIGEGTPGTGLSRRWPGRLAAWKRQRFATFFAATASSRNR